MVVLLAFFALTLVPAPPAFAAGDANKTVCPNEAMPGFRGYLPDCRAYEQVTPVFKDGFRTEPVSLRAGGSRLVTESVGFFAGATGPRCGIPFYDLTRAASGWMTTPFENAPLTEFAYSDPPAHCFNSHGALSDQGAVLLELRPASSSIYERDLYLRQPDGSLTLVGPMLPPSGFSPIPTGPGETPEGEPGQEDQLGASRDFSHVLFTLAPVSTTLSPGVKTQLWPGDTTTLGPGQIRASLYEYVGIGNTVPALVGVDNTGHLISDCGTVLGSAAGNPTEGNHMNAISADGTRVFFTALGAPGLCSSAEGAVPPVEELFARIAGSHTVAISQPQALSPAPPNEGCATPECKASTSEEANFRAASFEGASADGAKVFFTSPQQLLDDATQDPELEDRANRDGCEATVGSNGCNLYEYDFGAEAGHNLRLISGGDSSGFGPEVQGVAAISEDGSHAYFVARGVLTASPNQYGATAQAGQDNLYVGDTTTGQTTFIATLVASDSPQWHEEQNAKRMNVTDDGRFLLFTSTQHLTPDDTSAVQQVFRYDAVTGALLRVSIGNDGFNDDGNSVLGETVITRAAVGLSEVTPVDRHPALSEDGQVVVFTSSVALTPGALDNRCLVEEEGECFEFARNVYEYREGHVYLISDGRDVESSGGMVSPSGTDIFLASPDSLVPQDADTLGDIYDARANGGFPAPTEPASCQGEACPGAPSGAPEFGAPGSATFSGSGNVTPSVPSSGPVPKRFTRAQKLAAELKACRAKHSGHKRKACEARARKKYGSRSKTHKRGSK